MKFKRIASALAFAAVAAAAPSANAAFANGGLSVAGFFQLPGALTNLPGSMVSTLTSFDVTGGAGASGNGDFSAIFAVLNNDFSLSSTPVVMFTGGGFTFNVLSFAAPTFTAMNCATAQCTDARGFTAIGEVTGNGFQPTGFTLSWSAQASCNESTTTPGTCGANPTASWSASISATGTNPPVIPEPASLALVGLALAGVGFSARRRAAK